MPLFYYAWPVSEHARLPAKEPLVLKADYVVVGSGLTGAVIARLLHDAGREVVVLDRRHHAGGNVHDHVHGSGIRVHTYGPHYFRTSSDRIWDFCRRFGEFFPYHACTKSEVDGALENWPVAASFIARTVGPGWQPEFKGQPRNFEQAALSMMPRVIYEKFVKEYNEKQWGVPATSLSADLCKRFDVRLNDEPQLTPNARYQGIPVEGYARWMSAMIQGIPLTLNFDYLRHRGEVRARRSLIFTGPIDEFFDFTYGRLQYRGQIREHHFTEATSSVQPVGQVNFPQHRSGKLIRRLEWKHMMQKGTADLIGGTLVTTETAYSPTNPGDYEYPFPDQANRLLYNRYRGDADRLKGTVICGRLGEYRYYDMDQAIGRAMVLAEKLKMENR